MKPPTAMQRATRRVEVRGRVRDVYARKAKRALAVPVDMAAVVVSPIVRKQLVTEDGRFRFDVLERLYAEIPVNDVEFSLESICHRLHGSKTNEAALMYLLCLPRLRDSISRFECVLFAICTIFRHLSAASSQTMARFLQHTPYRLFVHIVDLFQRYLSMCLLSDDGHHGQAGIPSCSMLLAFLHRVNHERQDPIEASAFLNGAVNNVVDLYQQCKLWIDHGSSKFSFCNYPFLLDCSSKQEILMAEIEVYQEIEIDIKLDQLGYRDPDLGFFGVPMEILDPEVVIQVRRENLIKDTFFQLTAKADELLHPLRIQFDGEEGVDAGGIKKEFFHLVFRQLLDPTYGLFDLLEETGSYWFKPHNALLDSIHDTRLVGVLVALAIINDVTLGISFPLVLYKALLGLDTGLDDVRSISPTVYRSLVALLEYDGNVESVFCLNFRVSYCANGKQNTWDLKRNGANIPVTNANREEYVRLYARYLVHDAADVHLTAFKTGFTTLCELSSLKILQSSDLDAFVRGSASFDFEALQSVVVYEGYTAKSRTIRNLWSILDEYTEQEKRAFLVFLTGSDCMPIRGVSDMEFVVSMHGNVSRLPSAHTCFNHLMLPPYRSRSVLRERLAFAIANTSGFNME